MQKVILTTSTVPIVSLLAHAVIKAIADLYDVIQEYMVRFRFPLHNLGDQGTSCVSQVAIHHPSYHHIHPSPTITSTVNDVLRNETKVHFFQYVVSFHRSG